MKRICVVPHWTKHWGNRIFDNDPKTADLEGLVTLREAARLEGVQLDTVDVCPPKNADGIWFIDFPRNRSFFDELLAVKKRSAKIVLQVLESPLLVLQSQSRRNQMECDYVLTYDKLRASDPRYYHYKIPNYLELEDSGVQFSDRRCAVMINSNKQEGWFGSGEVGSKRMPGAGKYLNRWRIPLRRRLMPARGELYSWRRAFARAAECFDDRVLDVYGRGWTGEQITWLPLARPRPYQCAVGDLMVDPKKTRDHGQKIPLIGHYRFGIAVENFRGNEGYVSEKLFDVMRAGAVPVYLGDESITDVVPAGALVDARGFSNHSQLIHFLMNCSESDWESMRAKGRAFLSSPEAEVFGVAAFVETAMKVLRKL